ncbi:transmembrane protein 200A isoform X2 [Syngnathus typhle]|uniref:transmembrane protein 200A isoform X2 n=1 Tax=Syngnathus typhle TaxID=161592 RepID=UPI002A69A88E|nr:transmembrane protein 200A isoform X2 [Syngnathus typhle]
MSTFNRALSGHHHLEPSSGVTTLSMKTQTGKVTAAASSGRRKPRFTLRGRKKKDGVIRGKLRLRSVAGAFLVLGVMVVTVGTALAVAGYRMSRLSIPGAAEANGLSQPRGNWSLGAKGFLSPVSMIHCERMKLLGPVIMGVGLFILICANTVLYENRDRETQMLLAQMRNVICSVSAAVPSADLRQMALANAVSKHHWVSTLPAAQLNSLCRQQLASSEPVLQSAAAAVYRQTEALHHQESSSAPTSTDCSSCNSSRMDLDAQREARLSFKSRAEDEAQLADCLMSASSMSTLGLDDADSPAAQPRRCHSMSYRTKPYVAQSSLSAEKADQSDWRRGPLSGVSVVNIPGQVADEHPHRSWPRLDLGVGRRYLKLDNKEDSVDKLLDHLEQQSSQWDKSFGSGPFQ